MPPAPAIFGIEFNMATAPDLAMEFNLGGWTMAVQGKEFYGSRYLTQRPDILLEFARPGSEAINHPKKCQYQEPTSFRSFSFSLIDILVTFGDTWVTNW